MIRVYDFVCEDGHRTEHFIDSDTHVVQCECGKHANRTMPAPRSALEGFSGHFPGAADAWERRRNSKMAYERKQLERHGEYGNGHTPGANMNDTLGKK